jgi:hypothetical protein
MFRSFFDSKEFNKLSANVVNFLNNYLINDPTTPALSMNMQVPPMYDLKYAVNGLTFSPKTQNEVRSLNTYISVGNCLNNVQKHLKNPLKKWAGCGLLKVDPAAGVELNAYYDRASLKFFYYRHNGKTTYFSDSADIVTHELGHAILDSLRPDFWSVSSLEIWSFHEAFSDIVALFNLMNYDLVIMNTLKETNNNLKLSNNITKLAEEVGILIRSVTNDSAYLPNALRDPAIEKFKYVDPNTLPKKAPNNQLAAECHSFGRVFSNAWYEIFTRIYNYNLSQKQTAITAFRNARDIAFSILIQAIPNSPRVANYYSAIAKTMVVTAKSKGDVYSKIINDVFLEWKILNNNDINSLSSTSWKQVVFSLKKQDIVLKNGKSTIVCLKNQKIFKLNELPIVSSMSLSSDIEIEVPCDDFYEFDNQGNLVFEIKENEEEVKKSAALALMSISEKIGKNKMWNIENNRLTRKFIS